MRQFYDFRAASFPSQGASATEMFLPRFGAFVFGSAAVAFAGALTATGFLAEGFAAAAFAGALTGAGVPFAA